jgi:dTDP-4-amino-4,6-dideoxygalactose transaminase
MFTAYKNLGFNIKDYPNAFKQYENEITLPLHTKLSDEDVGYIAKSLGTLIS